MPYAVAIDLVSLIEQKSGIRLTRVASTYGGEFAGMCPFCKAGDDRFLVWPTGERPRWWCRVCEKNGDIIQFLIEYCNLSFPDACRELGIDLEDRTDREPISFSAQVARDDPPPARWQEAGWIFVERAEKYLWHPKSPEGRAALAYLRARGLTDETIKRARIGYCPAMKDGSWYSDSFEHWGIDPATITDEKKRARGTVVIAPGIVIPWTESGRLWKIAIKRPGVPKPDDYGQVLKSGEGLYNVSSVQFGQPVMIVESELCALSVMQEAGDLVNMVATGSTTRGRRPRWIADLSLASFVLQSFDADAPGDYHSDYWLQQLPQAIRWRPWADEWSEAGLRFKDPNDALREQDAFRIYTGHTLRGWVEQGIWAAELPAPDDSPALPLQGDEAGMPELPEVAQLPKDLSTHACPELDAYEAFSNAEVVVEPESRDAALQRYAETVARIVDVLGGPDRVTITKHEPNLSLKEHVQRMRWDWHRPAVL